jgi:hypothetical protein
MIHYHFLATNHPSLIQPAAGRVLGFGLLTLNLINMTHPAKILSTLLLAALLGSPVAAAKPLIAFKGIANSPYHYLGSAKILSRIGEAFAEALINNK